MQAPREGHAYVFHVGVGFGPAFAVYFVFDVVIHGVTVPKCSIIHVSGLLQ